MIASLVFSAGLLLAVPGALAQAAPVPAQVVAQLFSDKELVTYVCVENDGKCSAAEFGRRLESSKINVNAQPSRHIDAILVEPIRKHRQYFSTIFVRNGRSYREIFSADLSMSGMAVLPDVRNGYFVLQGRISDSYARWTEIDFIYDEQKKIYRPEKTRCVEVLDDETTTRDC